MNRRSFFIGIAAGTMASITKCFTKKQDPKPTPIQGQHGHGIIIDDPREPMSQVDIKEIHQQLLEYQISVHRYITLWPGMRITKL